MTTVEPNQTDPLLERGGTTSLVPGQVLAERYRIDAPLGSGGMGVVCRGTHLGLGTPVAIKLIRPDFAADAEFVGRFLNEARRAALLQSERIVRVQDVGQLPTGEPFLVMELLEGLELGQYLRERGPLDATDAVNIALQLAEGLETAHQSGIVHRDIKPANTFLVRRADGRFAVKILDFGISKQLTDRVTTLTDAGQSLGSPWYMSPEQMLDASRVDERSDLWSLGVVLFEMLAGQRPFDGATVPEVCAKVLTTPAPSLRDFRPELPPELEAIVGRCLQKEPSDRYGDVASLGAALHDYLQRHAVPTEPSVEHSAYFEADRTEGSIAPVATTRIRRRRRFALALGLVLLLLPLAVLGLAFGQRTVEAARHGAALLHSELDSGALVSAPAPVPTEPPAPPPAPAPILEPDRASVPAAASSFAASPPASASDPVPAATPAPASSEPTSSLAPGAGPERAEPARPFEPPLTEDEIAVRKERYARWLAAQGLTRVDERDKDAP